MTVLLYNFFLLERLWPSLIDFIPEDVFYPSFQFPFSPTQDSIMGLHSFVMTYGLSIIAFVFTLLFYIICVYRSKNFLDPNEVRFKDLTFREKLYYAKSFRYGPSIELIWTLLPALITIFIGMPSLALLYNIDLVMDPQVTIKVGGRQWFWNYTYPDRLDVAELSPSIRKELNIPESHMVTYGPKNYFDMSFCVSYHMIKNGYIPETMILGESHLAPASAVNNPEPSYLEDLQLEWKLLKLSNMDFNKPFKELSTPELIAHFPNFYYDEFIKDWRHGPYTRMQCLEFNRLWWKTLHLADEARLQVFGEFEKAYSKGEPFEKYSRMPPQKDWGLYHYSPDGLHNKFKREWLWEFNNEHWPGGCLDMVDFSKFKGWPYDWKSTVQPKLVYKGPYSYDSYMLPESELKKGQPRLLKVDKPLIAPECVHIRILVSSNDVLHSFGVPSAGIKIDAIPGRVNQIDVFFYHQGVVFGQCSELCGVNHGFMPIEVKIVDTNAYLKWIFSHTYEIPPQVESKSNIFIRIIKQIFEPPQAPREGWWNAGVNTVKGIFGYPEKLDVPYNYTEAQAERFWKNYNETMDEVQRKREAHKNWENEAFIKPWKIEPNSPRGYFQGIEDKQNAMREEHEEVIKIYEAEITNALISEMQETADKIRKQEAIDIWLFTRKVEQGNWLPKAILNQMSVEDRQKMSGMIISDIFSDWSDKRTEEFAKLELKKECRQFQLDQMRIKADLKAYGEVRNSDSKIRYFSESQLRKELTKIVKKASISVRDQVKEE